MTAAAQELSAGTYRRPDGRYAIATHAGEHEKLHSVHSAIRWAMAFVHAGMQAKHDAALARLGQEEMGMSPALAAQLLADVREGRELPTPSRYLQLTPGVSVFTGEPFVHAHLDGRLWTQLTPAQAADHALAVLQTIAAEDLDNRLVATLTRVGIDPEKATSAVGLLADRLPPDTVTGADLEAPGIDPQGRSDG